MTWRHLFAHDGIYAEHAIYCREGNECQALISKSGLMVGVRVRVRIMVYVSPLCRMFTDKGYR